MIGTLAPAENFLVLIALDDSYNTILSLGTLDLSVKWNHKESTMFKGVVGALSGGISLCHDHYSDCMDSQAYRAATRQVANWPTMDAGDDGATIRWRIDPVTFANAVDRQIANSTPMARLPSSLKIAILFEIRNLPFSSGNLARPVSESFWETDTARDPEPLRGLPLESRLSLAANGIAEWTYSYRLTNAAEVVLVDADYGEPVFDARCLLLTYELDGVPQRP
jgi:hypothetical protein